MQATSHLHERVRKRGRKRERAREAGQMSEGERGERGRAWSARRPGRTRSRTRGARRCTRGEVTARPPLSAGEEIPGRVNTIHATPPRTPQCWARRDPSVTAHATARPLDCDTRPFTRPASHRSLRGGSGAGAFRARGACGLRRPVVGSRGRVEFIPNDVGEHRGREQPVDRLEVAFLQLGALRLSVVAHGPVVDALPDE